MMNQLLKSSPPKMRLTTGMIRSLTSESTIFPNAAPMITPTARSTTLPLTANSRNSLMNDISPPCAKATVAWGGINPGPQEILHRRFAGFAGTDPDRLLDTGHEDLAI